MISSLDRTISNAKIKTVKLTVVVVLGHLFCSIPFVFIQLYAAWGEPDPDLSESLEFSLWKERTKECAGQHSAFALAKRRHFKLCSKSFAFLP